MKNYISMKKVIILVNVLTIIGLCTILYFQVSTKEVLMKQNAFLKKDVKGLKELLFNKEPLVKVDHLHNETTDFEPVTGNF